MELKRQLGEIERLEGFLAYLKDGDATGFLFGWGRHQVLRAELHDFRFFRREIDVELDAKVCCVLLVIFVWLSPPLIFDSCSHISAFFILFFLFFVVEKR